MISSAVGHQLAPAPPARQADRRHRLRACLLIAICCLLIYNANRRSISAGDTYPARYLPFAILQHQTLLLDPVADVTAQGRSDTAFWIQRHPAGHQLSLYPIVVPVLVAPLYVPAVAYLHAKGWSRARLDYVATVMEKLVASLLAALSAALLYLVLRRRTTSAIALWLTVAYAFGTTTWVISSQALWQHGMAQLLVVGVMFLITGPYSPSRALTVGLLCGLIVGNRPPDGVIAAALGVVALFWAGHRGRLLLAAGAATTVLLVLAYNLHYAGNFGGGYGRAGSPHFFRFSMIPGVAGLLFSPTKGLFVYSPFLLFLVLSFRRRQNDPAERRLTLVMVVAFVLQLVIYAKADWRAGLSWGPRYMTDLLPLLVWLLVPAVECLRRVGWIVFATAVAVSIAIQTIGAFYYLDRHDSVLYATGEGPGEMQEAWKWRNASFWRALQEGPAPTDLWVERRGAIDAVAVDDRLVTAIAVGEEAVVTGWALAGERSPARVVVSIDGKGFAATRVFSERPALPGAPHDPRSAGGWRLALDTSALSPGVHQLTVMAAASKHGENRFIDERTLIVRRAVVRAAGAVEHEEIVPQAVSAESIAAGDEDLEVARRTAAKRVAGHQQPEGYWLTAHTEATTFDDPQPEMNTYLTSLMVEVLTPVATANGLGENLLRARRHLGAQIESNGLVRYHGLPNGPGIGALGCIITPDTDDTALVWRVAPPADRQRLVTALATIERFRTPAGLYRTWLAPREEFQCLDPGSDPNPPDIGIQMHLFLLLAEERPSAAGALCAALQRVDHEERLWVYYAEAPLVPILRLPDLARARCSLELPESRLRSAVPGQQIWISLARLLAEPATGNGGSPADATRGLLRQLASDDFAQLRSDPPLLYHNDRSATVSRYYWSEDFGYALWLRLYDRL